MIKASRASRGLLLVLVLLFVVGCAANPVTGRSQLALVGEQQAIEQSALAFDQMAEQADTRAPDTAEYRRVARIANDLIAVAKQQHPETAGWDWRVELFDDPSVNAFAMAGGKIGMYTGFLETLEPTDDELAQVMGHEVAHALLGHSQEKMSIAMSQQLGLGLLGTLGERGQQMQSLAAQVGHLALTLPYSRTMEFEADAYGLELAARAGYDPNASITLWQKMQRVADEQGRAPPEFLSTHPGQENRIRALRELIPQVMPLYEQAY